MPENEIDMPFFKAWVKQSKTALARLQSVPVGDVEELEESVLSYIQCRYLLDQKPKLTDSIYDLAERSAAQIAKLSSAQLSAMEDMSGCTGAKSAMVKKVLLLMSLNEHLHWGLDEDACQSIERVADIVRYHQSFWNKNRYGGVKKC